MKLFWQGTLSATVAGVLSLILADFVVDLLTQLLQLDATSALFFRLAFILLFHLVNLFCMGMIGTFFWYCLTTQKMGFTKLLLILMPYYGFPFLWMAYANRQRVDFLAGIPFVVVATLLSLWPLNASINFGLKWWPKRRYRHFFGLANNYERDEDVKSP